MTSILQARLISISVAMVLIATAVVAIAFWPKSASQPANQIVGYDTQTCAYVTSPAKTAGSNEDFMRYYEIQPGFMTAETKLEASLKATCQDHQDESALGSLIEHLPPHTANLQTTPAHTVLAITADSITVSPDPHYDAAIYRIKPNLTYTHFADPVLVYEKNTRIAYRDLRAGDTIRMVVQYAQENISEPISADTIALNHPEDIKVMILLKTQPLRANPDAIGTELVRDVLRVKRCSSSPTGFCRL